MERIGALVLFAFVSAATPGPNNVLLWASGVRFGFRATLPQVVGTALGIGALAVGVAAGIGVAVTAVPGLELALRLVGSAYLLLLALRVAGGHALEPDHLPRPLLVRQAAAFQLLNPKAWLFALAAMGTFRPTGLPVLVGSALVTGVLVVVVLPAAALWAAGGTALHRAAAHQRALGAALAALLVASVVFIWI